MTSSTADTLVNRKCVPCRGGVSAIAPAEAKRMVGQLLDEGWQLVEDGKALKREFKFAGKPVAIADDKADVQNPQLVVTYGEDALSIPVSIPPR